MFLTKVAEIAPTAFAKFGNYFLVGDVTATTPTGAFSSSQTESVKTALTSSAQTVLQTFIDLLPIIALIVGVVFGIRFVKSQFNKVQKAR